MPDDPTFTLRVLNPLFTSFAVGAISYHVAVTLISARMGTRIRLNDPSLIFRAMLCGWGMVVALIGLWLMLNDDD